MPRELIKNVVVTGHWAVVGSAGIEPASFCIRLRLCGHSTYTEIDTMPR